MKLLPFPLTITLICGSMDKCATAQTGPSSQLISAAPNHSLGDPEDLVFTIDKKLTNELNEAIGLINREAWTKAIVALQAILDGKRDGICEVQRVTPNGLQVVHVSAKTEANHLIGSMPEKARKEYRRLYGEKAAELLTKATEKSDKNLLSEIAQRYMYTEAGEEAMGMLATYLLDRSDFAIVSLTFERFISHKGIDNVPPLTLFHAAIAFRYAGDFDSGDEMWKSLKGKIAKRGLRLGDGTVLTLEQVEKLLLNANPPPSQR